MHVHHDTRELVTITADDGRFIAELVVAPETRGAYRVSLATANGHREPELVQRIATLGPVNVEHVGGELSAALEELGTAHR